MGSLVDIDGSVIEHGFEVLLTPKETAAILAVGVATVTRYAKEGKLRCIRTEGGHRRYPADAVRAASEGRWEDAAQKRSIDEMSPADVLVAE